MKVFVLLLMVITMLLSSFTLVGCGDENNKIEHVHTFDSSWSYDDNNHWRKSVCEHKDLMKNMSNHEFGEDNLCVVCGAGKKQTSGHEHTFSINWESDSEYHWNVANCEHVDEVMNKMKHIYGIDNKCIVCERQKTDTEVIVEKNVKAVTPSNNSLVKVANDSVDSWYKQYKYSVVSSVEYFDKHQDLYYPNPITLKWDVDGNANYYRVTISLNKDLSKGENYIINDKSLMLDHLLPGYKYYWQVDCVFSKEMIRSNVFTFQTEFAPRGLRVDGVSNTRDIGGYNTVDGYRVKPGMIYRGGRLDDVTPFGKEFLLDTLGIKTDVDLRTPGEEGAGKGSPLGQNINYFNFDGRYYTGEDTGISTLQGKEIFANEIRTFANANNYPIYFHCSLGRDRTGTLAIVIEGLLGMSKNDIFMDYELSFFSVGGTASSNVISLRDRLNETYDYLNRYEGETFAEKVEDYLLSIGITKNEIQSIRNIMLEKYN